MNESKYATVVLKEVPVDNEKNTVDLSKYNFDKNLLISMSSSDLDSAKKEMLDYNKNIPDYTRIY